MIKKILALALALVMLTACFVSCKPAEETQEFVDSAATLPGVPENAVVKTENFGFTANQIEYYFNYAYQNFIYSVESYGLSLTYFGLDTTKPLKEQACTPDDTVDTWFDYFMNEALTASKNVLIICEAALAAGYELSEEDVKTVDDNIATFRDGAAEKGVELEAYLEEQFDFAMTEATFVNTMVLSAYSGAYADYVTAQADVSEEAVEAAYEANKILYETFDYLAYGVTTEDIGKDATVEDCKAIVSKVAKATTAEEFKALVKESLKSDFELEDSEITKAISSIEYLGSTYDSSDFHNLLLTAKEGDCGFYVEEHTKGAIAYFFIKRNPRDDSIDSRDVRHILFLDDTYKDDTKAREVYDKWVADGAKVEDFIELAAEYSEDTGSAEAGGLYEGVTEGMMVAEFNDWLFDEKREVGDHAIVKTKDFGWHIMYYEGGMPSWKRDVIEQIKSEAYAKVNEQAIKDFPVTIDEAAIAEIDA